MVDISKLQLHPIPDSILELQEQISTLQQHNKSIKNVILVVGVVITIYLLSKAYTKGNEADTKKGIAR